MKINFFHPHLKSPSGKPQATRKNKIKGKKSEQKKLSC